MLTNFFAINIMTIFVENCEKFFNKIDKISFTKKQLKKNFLSNFTNTLKFSILSKQTNFFSKKLKKNFLSNFTNTLKFSILSKQINFFLEKIEIIALI